MKKIVIAIGVVITSFLTLLGIFSAHNAETSIVPYGKIYLSDQTKTYQLNDSTDREEFVEFVRALERSTSSD